ncbi:MAG: hypothetical protein S4CHLAM2_03560 [Chlamydiales bacterium]|nr:hypothetical protein [Chlamydiales bacterium]
MDFVTDQLYTGQRLRLLTIVDNFTRVSPFIGVGFHYKGADVVRSLDEALARFGMPSAIQVDNGPEFVSKELGVAPIKSDH